MLIFKNFIGFQSRLSRDSGDWSSTQSRLNFFQSTPVDSVVYASLSKPTFVEILPIFWHILTEIKPNLGKSGGAA